MPKVVIPPPYQGPTQGVGRVEVPGATVRACLESLERRFPGFGAQVVDERGTVHRFVKLFVNGEQLGRADLDRRLDPGDEVEILAAIAGG